jgi:hypothetical protein
MHGIPLATYGGGKEGNRACQLKRLLTFESKILKFAVTDANKSSRGFEAKALPLEFMT